MNRPEYIDGHRWPQKAVTPDDVHVAPVDAPRPTETPQTQAPDQQPAGAASDDLPPFSVRALINERMVAVLFLPEHIPYLMRHPLFASSAGLLEGAQIDIETEIDQWDRDERDRQLRQVGR